MHIELIEGPDKVAYKRGKVKTPVAIKNKVPCFCYYETPLQMSIDMPHIWPIASIHA